MSRPTTAALNTARRRLARRPEPHNPDAMAELAMRALEEGAKERTLSYILGSSEEFRRRYLHDAYFHTALDAIIGATIEATFHHDPAIEDAMEEVDLAVMAPVLNQPPEFEVGQRWRDQWGRTLEILDASSDPLSVQWTPGGIAPSPIRREHLRSDYTLVGVAG